MRTLLLVALAFFAVSCIKEYQYFGDTTTNETICTVMPTDSLLTDKDGNAVKFYLGKFEDIEGFDDFAQKALRGSIEYWIGPTKDATSMAYVEIKPAFASGMPALGGQEWGLVGPCIYDKGRQWDNPWGDEMITSDWSPASELHKVRLTPKAEAELTKLLSMLKKGKIHKTASGYAYEEGIELSKLEVKDAVKYGILVPVE